MKTPLFNLTRFTLLLLTGFNSSFCWCKENDGHEEWKLVQFTPKPERFPKCVGEEITREDFTIVTSPTTHEHKCEVDFPDGTNSVGTFNATCTPPSDRGDALSATYEVGTRKKDSFIEDEVQVKFTAVDDPEEMSWIASQFGINYTYRQNWIVGERKEVEFDFPEKKKTGWSPCGGAIEESNSEGHSVGGTLSRMWTLAMGQGTVTASYTWNTQSVITYGHKGVNNRKIMISTHDQKVTIKIAYENTHTRRGEKFVQYRPPLLSPRPQITWGPWGPKEEDVSGDEEASGAGTPQKVLHVACCN